MFNNPSVLFSITIIVLSYIASSGALESVKELRMENAVIKWEAPFSLNLTNIDPDIIYCVDIYNITCGARDHLISDCNVTDTSYNFDAYDCRCEYTVTPRSNTKRAMNGTPNTGICFFKVWKTIYDISFSCEGCIGAGALWFPIPSPHQIVLLSQISDISPS